MHALAARTVRQALAAGACIDPVDHFADLRALDAAARNERDAARADVLDLPVVIGDPDSRSGSPAILWSPSYAAMDWVQKCASLWFSEPFRSVAVCWALANARDPETIRAAADSRIARRTIRTWAAGLSAGLMPMFEAASRLIHAISKPDEQPAKAAAGGDCPIGRTLALLCQEFGQPEDYWLFGPIRRMDEAVELLARQEEEAAKAIAKAKGGVVAADPDSPQVLAFVRWRAASEAFLKKFVPAPPPAEVPRG